MIGVRTRGRFVVLVIGLLAAIPMFTLPGLRAGADRAQRSRSGRPVRAHLAEGPPLRARDPVPPTSSGDNPLKSVRGIYAYDGPGDMSPAVRGDPERVYVPDNLDATVTVIDPHTFKVVHRYRVGSNPQHVTPSWDLRRLYVDNNDGNSLTVIDPRSERPTRTIARVPDPYNLYFTPDGRRAIVVAEREHRLDFRNPRTWRLIKSVPIPWSGVDHMDFTADGRYLVASCEFSGMVVKVDTRRMKVMGHLRVGGLPVDVKLSPGGRVFYVANQGLNGVSVVGARRMRLRGFIPTGAGAHGLAVGRDARTLYVSNRLAGSISVISFSTRKVVDAWHVGGSPDMEQVSPDGRRLWVSNRFDGTVSVIDTSSGRVIHVIPVGPSPHGLALFPQPGRHSLGHNGVYR